MAIVDRFEEDWAVIEHEGKTFNFPRSLLPVHVREGDVLRFAIAVDKAGTADRRREIMRLEDELFR